MYFNIVSRKLGRVLLVHISEKKEKKRKLRVGTETKIIFIAARGKLKMKENEIIVRTNRYFKFSCCLNIVIKKNRNRRKWRKIGDIINRVMVTRLKANEYGYSSILFLANEK